MEAPRIGLVLGAGGTVGGAFHAGVLGALAEATGWDPRTAAVVVGTSAGSITGTGLRAGLGAADAYASATGRPVSAEGARLLGRFVGRGGGFTRTGSRRLRPPAAVAATLAGAVARPLAARPGALLATLVPDGVVGTEVISDGVEALTGGRWPDDPLWICAVRQRDGRRVTFGRDPGRRPPLPAAVAASCAIPAFFAPVDVEGEAFVDGGAHSPTNADVLRGEGLDLVVVVSPMSIAGRGLRLAPDQPARRWARARLDAEARTLRRAGVPVLAFQPTAEDAAVMAGNALDPAKRGPVARRAHASTRVRLERPDVADRLALLRS